VTTPILHPTRLSLRQYPFTQCLLLSVIRQMFFLNEDSTRDAFHPEICLEFPDLFEVRSTLWGFCLLQEEYNFFNDFCDAFDQLRFKIKLLERQILCVL